MTNAERQKGRGIRAGELDTAMLPMEYVCMGMGEGGSRNASKLGALIGGLYIGGGFTDSLRVELWENQEKYVGRVFQAYGMVLFNNFVVVVPAGDFTGFNTLGACLDTTSPMIARTTISRWCSAKYIGN